MRKFTNPKTLKGQDKINRITNLMSRMTTLNEGTSLSEIDFIKKGPNGIVYGIIRENHNYFIKTTEKTSGTLIAEDFEYVGGVKNKYIERYNTYTEALKQLNMKFDMLNESYGIETGSNLFESDGREIKVSNASGVVVKETKVSDPDNDDDGKLELINDEEEDVEEQKQVIKVKTPKAPVEDTVEVDEFAMDDMETAEGGGEDPFAAEDGGEGMDGEGMDDEGMDGEDGDETTKKIQKLTGKVTQLMRDMDDPDSELDKYVINSVISAINFEEMDDEDVEDVIAKIEGEDEEAGEGDEFDTEEVDVDLDVEEFPEGEPSEDQITEDSEGRETFDYGEDEGHDHKEEEDLKEKEEMSPQDRISEIKKHLEALESDMSYDEDHEDREEEGTEFNESRSFSKKQLMETFLRKNVKNSLKKVLKENHSMCEECLGEGCESCMGEHHQMDASKEVGGRYYDNEYMLEDDDMDMLAGDDVHEDIDYMETEMLGQDVLYRTGEEPKFDRDGDGISNEYDVDSNDDGSIDYGMGNKMYDWPERTFGRKGDRDSDGIPNTNDDNPGTPSWEDEGDDFIEIDFESLMGNAPVKKPGVAPPTTTPSTKPGKPRWKKIRKPEPGTQGLPKAEVERKKATIRKGRMY